MSSGIPAPTTPCVHHGDGRRRNSSTVSPTTTRTVCRAVRTRSRSSGSGADGAWRCRRRRVRRRGGRTRPAGTLAGVGRVPVRSVVPPSTSLSSARLSIGSGRLAVSSSGGPARGLELSHRLSSWLKRGLVAFAFVAGQPRAFQPAASPSGPFRTGRSPLGAAYFASSGARPFPSTRIPRGPPVLPAAGRTGQQDPTHD